MGKKTKEKTTSVAKTTRRPKARKTSKKLFKPKKGKEIIKGLVSVAVNAGIQKGMTSIFEDRIKKDDFKKKNSMGNEYVDAKAYQEAVEKQKTLHGGANIGLWLAGVGNALPKDYVSAEYLEINALEHGTNTFLGKSKKENIKKVAPYVQGIERIEGIEGDEEANQLIEASDTIEDAMAEAYIENEEEDVAFLESAIESDDDDVVYQIEGMEGMNQVIPGIEEETY